MSVRCQATLLEENVSNFPNIEQNVPLPVSMPIFRFTPLHVRLLKYNKVRNRIFAEEIIPARKPKRSTVRWGDGDWKKIKTVRKYYCSTIINDTPKDGFRPYGNVGIFGISVAGLIDTGRICFPCY